MKTINSIFSKSGYSIARNETVKRAASYPFMKDSYLRTLRDYETVLRASLFPDLPTVENRHDLMLELVGNPVIEAFYILNYLHLSLKVAGDVCEFGVAEGTNSALMANELLRSNRKLWLFDSFQGLPKPTEKDRMLHDIFGLGEMAKYEGTMAHPQSRVKARLERVGFPVPRTEIIAGFIERVPETSYPQKVCFAYVDFDFYEPIKIALERLHPRMDRGAYVVVDDYGFFSEGAAVAVEEFLASNSSSYERLSPEPHAQGFMVLKKLL
ncbi:MAG: hypothetical protein KDD39_01970 [Bdellovibrionales bacterium]|nr:hypothetical protein [Bdellovibrionales bacterium]